MRTTTLVCVVISVSITHGSNLCSMETPCTPLKGGKAFAKPHEEVSEDGFLKTNIKVGMATYTLDWLSTERRLYNGSFPGPTLRIKAGDRVILNLVNSLQKPDYVNFSPNTFRFPNSTNVHTHGLHISSEEPQDDVLVKIPPNSSYNYDYRIHPHQPAGTFWYHPHLHGSGFFQNHGGMAGMLIVEDDPQTMTAELNSASCPNNCDRDIPVVFQLFRYSTADEGSFSLVQREIHDDKDFRLNKVNLASGHGNLEEWLENPANNIQYVLVNGQLQPTLTIRQGQIHRFRLLNAGALYALALHITDMNGAGNPCKVKEIALDGHYLEKPRHQRLGRSIVVAAGRVDWLVICPQAGHYQLKSTFLDADAPSVGEIPKYTGQLLTLVVAESSEKADTFPTNMPEKPAYMGDLRNVKPSDVCGKFAVEFTPTATVNRENFTRSFRYVASVGEIQEFHITNTEYASTHTYHMHVNSFQVISYNNYTGPYGVDDGGWHWRLFSQKGETCKWQHSAYNASVQIVPPTNPLKYLGHDKRQARGGVNTVGYAQIGDWMDTLLIPPLANITIRFRTDTYTGTVFAHCHLLDDADHGMVLLMNIVEKGKSLKANTTSAGAYEGACMENNPVDKHGCKRNPNWQIWFILSQIWNLGIAALYVLLNFLAQISS